MVTQPCMWPASANTWPCPAAYSRAAEPGRGTPPPWTSSCKAGKVQVAAGPVGGGIGDGTPLSGKGGHSLSIDHLQF